MTTAQDDVHKIIDDAADIPSAARAIFNSPRRVVLYVLGIGVEAIRSKRRRKNRSAIKRDIQPQFKPGPVHGSIVLTDGAKKRLKEHTEQLFGPEGWMIGNLNIGMFTKDMLCAQALREEASAKGNLVNAKIYRALAEPMRTGETVQQHWDTVKFKSLAVNARQAMEHQRPTLM